MSVTYEEVLKMKNDQKILLPLTRKDLKILPDIIDINEKLISFIQSNDKPQGVLCVTNKRLLYLSKELTTKNLMFGKRAGLVEKSIQLKNINSVQLKQQILYGTLLITDGAQTYNFEKLTAAELDRFVHFLKRQMDNPDEIKKTTKKRKTPSIDGTEEIKKYKELLDLDIITQNEFDSKKKELLNL